MFHVRPTEADGHDNERGRQSNDETDHAERDSCSEDVCG